MPFNDLRPLNPVLLPPPPPPFQGFQRASPCGTEDLVLPRALTHRA